MTQPILDVSAQQATAEAGQAPDWLRWALSQRSTSRHVEANGKRLHVLCWNAERQDLPALLFVHGFRGHAHWWDFIAPFFVEHHRVYAMDLSGMGDSDHRQGYSSGELADDVIAVAEAVGNGPLVAVGHSYGGSRILRACARRPELFLRLVVIDSYVVASHDPPLREPVRIRGTNAYATLEEGMARFRLMPAQPDGMPALLAHVARHSLKQTAEGWRWKFDPDMPAGGDRERNGEEMLAQVTRPVDYVRGERSVVATEERARFIIEHLPQVRGPIVIPDGHHHLMFDQPIALIGVLRALLADAGHGRQAPTHRIITE
jgi:pimeloyl-ACP methyl ester carboxylesterase